MIHFQVEIVDSSFAALKRLECNGWQETQADADDKDNMENKMPG